MASAIVRAAIHSAVQKTPSQSQITLKLKEKAEEILTKVSVEEEAMDKFSVDMLTYLRVEVRSVADKYKGSSKKGNIYGQYFIKSEWKQSFHLCGSI